MTDADLGNDQALLVNTPAQAEPLQRSLQHATGDIGFYFNASQTEHMCFKQKYATCSLRRSL